MEVEIIALEINSSKPIKLEGATQRRERLAAIIGMENKTTQCHHTLLLYTRTKNNVLNTCI